MKKNFSLLIISSLLAFHLHKYHLSNSKIVYNKEKQTVQITMRYFVDDIETALNNKNDTITELGTKKEVKNIEYYLKKYIATNFKIKINETKINVTYLGHKVKTDIIHFYLEATNIADIETLYVENNMLIRDFNDQKNIIKLRINNTKKTFVLHKKKYSLKVDY